MFGRTPARTTGEASGKLWENMHCELRGKGGMGAGRPGDILRLPVSLELNEHGVNMPSSWGRKRMEKCTAECVSSSPGSSTDVQQNPLQIADVCLCLSFPFWETRWGGKFRAIYLLMEPYQLTEEEFCDELCCLLLAAACGNFGS